MSEKRKHKTFSLLEKTEVIKRYFYNYHYYVKKQKTITNYFKPV